MFVRQTVSLDLTSNACIICTKCVKLRFNGGGCVSVCFICETLSQISMKFGTNRSCEADLILVSALYRRRNFVGKKSHRTKIDTQNEKQLSQISKGYI